MITYSEEKRLTESVGDGCFRMAKVISYTANTAVVQFDGEDTASTKAYKRIYGVTITTGDRVLCARVSGTYVVIGAIR